MHGADVVAHQVACAHRQHLGSNGSSSPRDLPVWSRITFCFLLRPRRMSLSGVPHLLWPPHRHCSNLFQFSAICIGIWRRLPGSCSLPKCLHSALRGSYAWERSRAANSIELSLPPQGFCPNVNDCESCATACTGECFMAVVVTFFQDAAFDPETTSVMGDASSAPVEPRAAVTAVCQGNHRGDHRGGHDGERDPIQLCGASKVGIVQPAVAHNRPDGASSQGRLTRLLRPMGGEIGRGLRSTAPRSTRGQRNLG